MKPAEESRARDGEDPRREPIAIVGLACRFPGAKDAQAFWTLLRNGVDAVSEVPPDRWDVDAFYDPDPGAPGKMSSRWGGFLDQVDGFDPEFFGISPREAASMDPQHRLLLELSWEALEDAGLVARELSGTPTGVFVGISTNDYGQLEARDPRAVTAYWSTGNALNIAASRISYFLDLRGPALAIDTACSASLVAVHHACLSLWTAECTLALAAGVNLILSPTPMINFTKAGALARDGRCKAFDARADGVVRGEGAGLVVLKPLSRALRDGDPIRALIRGSAVNQDGQTNGLTAPSRHAQEAVLRSAYRAAGVAPEQVTYVEAHGTGTLLGDPIEMKALANVISAGRPADRPCAVGSVKTNIGHLESAAGIASLIKVVLSLEHGELPPSLHFREPNPHIAFERLRLEVQHTLRALRPEEQPVICGVSSFGFGGTNAHLVVEQAPRPRPAEATGEPAPAVAQLLPLSAQSVEALQELARSWVQWLEDHGTGPHPDLSDVCYTAGVRRTHLARRLAVVVRSRDQLVRSLREFLEGRAAPAVHTGRGKGLPRAPGVVFVFSGQGAGWWPLSRAFVDQEPAVRETLERCDEVHRSLAGWSLLGEMAARERVPPEEMELLQPAAFSLQVALAALWTSWGIRAVAVVGHSLGELAAAHIAGALSLEDALRVVRERGRLMQEGLRQSGDQGGMAAVRLSLPEAVRLVAEGDGQLSIAAHNSPRLVILSGPITALRAALRSFDERRVAARLVPIPGAGHAAGLARLAEELVERVREIRPRAATLPLYSGVTGRLARGEELDPAYWGRNVAQPVLFSGAVQESIQAGHDAFLEIGRHPILAGALVECLAACQRPGTVLASLRRGEEERQTLLGSLGALYARGASVRWPALYAPRGRCVALPGHPWRRRRVWFGDEALSAAGADLQRAPRDAARGPAAHSTLGRHLRSAASPDTHLWPIRLHEDEIPFLRDFRLEGLCLIPPALFVDLFLKAADEALPAGARALEDLRLLKPAFLPAGGVGELQLILTVKTSREAEARIYTVAEAGPTSAFQATLVAETRIRAEESPQGAGSPCHEAPERIRGRCPRRVAGADLYQALAQGGLLLGPAFRGIEELWTGPDDLLGRVAASAGDAWTGGVPPEALEAGIHAALNAASFDVDDVRWPEAIDRVERPAPAPGSREAWIHAARGRRRDGRPGVDVFFVDESGRPLLTLRGVGAEVLPRYMQESSLLEWMYGVEWPRRERRSVAPPEPGRFVLLCDRQGVGEALASRLVAAGHSAVRVYPRGADVRSPPECPQVDLSKREELSDVLERAAAGGAPLRGVVHLWSLDSPDAKELTVASLKGAQVQGCGSALLALQALARLGGDRGPRLWLVTQGAQPVGEPGPLALAQAPLWGFGRAIAGEKPALWGGLIDLDPSASVEQRARWLCDEVAGADGEDQIAFRAGARHVARLRRTAPTPVGSAGAPAWDPDGVYLLSGGLGELGLLVARWLAEQGARRIVLLGRTALPPRAAWHEIEEGSRQGRQVAAIRAIESLGAAVQAFAVDVADQDAMRDVLGTLRQQMGRVRGVVHLAGVAQGASLEEMDTASLEAELQPKLLGGWVLHSLLSDEPLDFFVMFSSASAVLSSPLLSGYAAANAFLDALAHHRRALGQTAVSIGWGFWQEAGLAARRLREWGRDLTPRGLLGLTNRQGLALLERLLRHDRPHAVVMHYNWKQWARVHAAAAASPFFEGLFAGPPAHDTGRGSPAGPDHIRDVLLRAALEARGPMMESYLRDRVAAALGTTVAEVDPHQPLTSMGIDSLMALEMKHRIELDLGIVIPVAELLTGPTVFQLGALLLGRLQQDIAGLEPDGGSAGPGEPPRSIPSLDDPAGLLRHIDRLSDQQVDELLRSMGVGD